MIHRSEIDFVFSSLFQRRSF